ncbi:MAG TPA: cysteine-rich CWC family protein [Burkholderiaceae bacterium]|nr:cysteine-rich CWC family protein [Burkholderiaceae bacterium]
MKDRVSDLLLEPSQRTCPLCGGPNGCAPASSGSFGNRCWCEDASFGADLLGRVPPECRGTHCICAACAGAAGPAGLGTSRE